MPTPQFDSLPGSWSGTSRLFFEGRELDSASNAEIRYYAQRKFLSITYTWQIDDQPQDGLIVFPSAPGAQAADAVWLDSWHMGQQVMRCQASLDPAGAALLLGSYAAPPDPDWGWRIEIGAGADSSFSLHMFNIMPDGQEQLAVLAHYLKTSEIL